MRKHWNRQTYREREKRERLARVLDLAITPYERGNKEPVWERVFSTGQALLCFGVFVLLIFLFHHGFALLNILIH